MLEQLQLLNLSAQEEVNEKITNQCFVLRTCQRTLVISTSYFPKEINRAQEVVSGKEAYKLLLEIICGLQSKLVGENEIVGQFKAAYQNYVESSEKCTVLLHILEKLFNLSDFISISI